MKNLLLALAVASFLPSAIYAQQERQPDYEALKKSFQDPPQAAKPKVYWWCLNGNIDTVAARSELLAMKTAGLGGFDLFEIGVPKADSMIVPGGPAFLSDESLQAIQFVVKEAGKLGLDMGLNLASSWNAGGSWTQPQHAAKSLYQSATTLRAGGDMQELKVTFPEIRFPASSLVGGTGRPMIPLQPNGRPVYYEDVAILAIPANLPKGQADTSRIINVTAYFNAQTDMLRWKAPSGDWQIMRYVCSNSGQQVVLPSPKSAGLTIDHFDSVAVKTHLMYVINRLQPVLGDFRKTALKNFYLASYEARGFVWSSTLPAEFKKINGYDIYKFLPSLYDEAIFSAETNRQIQVDFKKTLSEMMINNLYKAAQRLCNSYGLKINSEAGGPGYPLYNGPAEPLKALGAVDIPRGEFWINHSRMYKDTNDNGIDSIDVLHVIKEVAAAAHIYNRRIVEEESFTSFQHWQEGPFDMKPYGDEAFCEGMNRVVFHGFGHIPRGSGVPGYVYNAGTHFNNKQPWWPMVNPFISYLSRISAVFQQADFVADVLYYYGDKIPNSATPKNTHFVAGPGYDYEVINTEILLNNLTVKNGKLMLSNGASFSLLALEPEENINPRVLTKLAELAKQGAVIIGARPKGTTRIVDQSNPGRNTEAEINTLWAKAGEAAAQSGKIVPGIKASTILATLNVKPDFDYHDKESWLLDFIHYQHGGVDVYFIANTSNQWVSRLCSFRQQSKVPELWDPVTGKITPVTVYDQQSSQTNMPITLAPFGSYFIVFKNGGSKAAFTSISNIGTNPPRMQFTSDGMLFLDDGEFELKNRNTSKRVTKKSSIQTIGGEWKVSFTKGWGAPEHVVFPELQSWTNHANAGVKYYSGVATYNKTFKFGSADVKRQTADGIPTSGKIFLDLGDVSEVARVWLNDKPLGVVWAMPYTYEITGLLKKGTNTLRVEVANDWSNRLAGDAITGEKFTNTNIKISSRGVKWADTPLIPSGLLGPVTITRTNLIK